MRRIIDLLIMLVVLVAVLGLAGCTRSDFGKQASAAGIEAALKAAGLQVCASDKLAWSNVPGFVEGTYYRLNLDCAGDDPNSPGDLLTVARFSSAEARDAALRNFQTTHRRQPGLANSWTLGPYVLLSDGPQQDAVAPKLEQVMKALGAE